MQSMCTLPVASKPAYNTAVRIVQIARVLEHPEAIPAASPLIPMCLFITLKCLLVMKRVDENVSVNMDDITVLKGALGQLGKVFPVARKYHDMVCAIEQQEDAGALYASFLEPPFPDSIPSGSFVF